MAGYSLLGQNYMHSGVLHYPSEEDLHCTLPFAHNHNAFTRSTGLTGIRYTVAGRQQLLPMKTSYCLKNVLSFDLHFSRLKGLSWGDSMPCSDIPY